LNFNTHIRCKNYIEIQIETARLGSGAMVSYGLFQ
jgi:hypothetical protein